MQRWVDGKICVIDTLILAQQSSHQVNCDSMSVNFTKVSLHEKIRLKLELPACLLYYQLLIGIDKIGRKRRLEMSDNALQAKYSSKLCAADEAVRMIRSGQRVFIGSSCGEPQHLVNALMDNADHFSDVEIVRLLSLEGSLLSLMADEYRGHKFHVRSIYQGSDQTKSLRANKRFITPITLWAVPVLFKKKMMPLHFALIQVSPPDDNGWMSLGISVDVKLAAARSATVVIAQVNAMMPRIPGHSFIHLDDVSVIVEQEEELLSAFKLPA